MSEVKPVLALILVGAAIMVMFLPAVAPSPDTELVAIRETADGVLLVGRSGQLEIPLSDAEFPGVYSSENFYDFVAELVESSTFSRVEVLPYGTGTICNVQTSQGRSVAGRASFCVALALRTGTPLHVHTSLLVLETTLPQGV